MSTLKTTNIAHPSATGNNIVLDSGGGAAFSQIKGGAITSGTSVASTSGTSIDFTGIPSWAKRITVMFDGVSGSAASDLLFQLGDSGGIETSGYLSAGTQLSSGSLTTTNYTAGIGFPWGGITAKTYQGFIQFVNLTGNTWVANGAFGRSDTANTLQGGGSKTLSDVLTQVRITHVNGTDTFDAGTINILYEG